MNKPFCNSGQRLRVPPEDRLPLNVRSAGHSIVHAGWRHPSGVVDRYNFYWGVKGEVNYTVDDKLFTMHPCEVLVFPLNSRMGPAAVDSEGEYRWFTLDGSLANPLFKELGIEFYVPFKAGACPSRLHENLIHSFNDIMPIAAMNSEIIVYEILINIRNNREISFKKDNIDKCREIIDTGFTESSLDVSAVADEAGVDRTVLARQFKALNGISPSKYLQGKRLMRSLRYLEAGYTTVETARRCGYNDAGYFARSFKKHFALSPQAWRDSILNKI